MPLLELRSLNKTFRRPGHPTVRAVRDVSLEIRSGETLALIGESGSGKTTCGRLALRLLVPDSGEVLFDGTDLSRLDEGALRKQRALFSVVFQEPFESLNPRKKIGKIIGEPLAIHAPTLSRDERRAKVIDALKHVALDESFYDRYPRALSGGQQQRVGVARAIVLRPKLIVLDEPTSSLDLSVRAQVLTLLKSIQQELGLAYLFISHDIDTVAYIADRVAVMYLGRIVESGPTSDVLHSPLHPYTQALLSSTLSPDPSTKKEQIRLSGEIPNPESIDDSYAGCLLYGRCPISTPECAEGPVPLAELRPAHRVACIHVR